MYDSDVVSTVGSLPKGELDELKWGCDEGEEFRSGGARMGLGGESMNGLKVTCWGLLLKGEGCDQWFHIIDGFCQ
ncbi:hypothetical protein V6N12_058824 [Hibiscus sabdariffa]|uniref:Uncharacterized protein n=1 Tax=Hibiscus sabdariffa TaxID=183260 RepID=A0ABR2ETA1_9ROSI